MTAKKLDIFDLSRWKPIPLPEFVSELGMINVEQGDVSDHAVIKYEYLPDNRFRGVISAHVRYQDGTTEHPPETEFEPYLMVLWDHLVEELPPGKKPGTWAFVRSDVVLEG